MARSLRMGRAGFAARGLPCAVNVLLLFFHAMGKAFTPSQESLLAWVDLPMILVCLTLLLMFAMRRGRDLGWPGGATAAGMLLAVGVAPLLPLLVIVLLALPAQPGAEHYGAPPPRDSGWWLATLLLLAWPWLILWLLHSLGWPR